MVGGDAVVGEGVVASEQLSVNGRLGSCLISPVVTSFQNVRDKQAEGTAGRMPVLHEEGHAHMTEACMDAHIVQSDSAVTLLIVVFAFF